jgi:Protein of unknown function (DUF3179)
MTRRFAMGAALVCYLGLVVANVAAQPDAAAEPAKEPTPPGVQQLLARGGIPAVFEPQFVTADEAEISDDAWVLGVVIDGEARAYSLNLLNHHEVVNDRVGDHPFAAVW